MKPKYENILRPLQIGSFVLKNRLECASCLPHFLQGPEDYPADSVITHFANKAKNGAAIVTVRGVNNYGNMSKRGKLLVGNGGAQMPGFELYEPSNAIYLAQTAEAIHYYNAIACMALVFMGPSKFPLLEEGEDRNTLRWLDNHPTPADYTLEELSLIADSYAQQAKILQSLGYDMVSLHFAYRGSLASRFLSPLTNNRTDEFGGDCVNRARFPVMILERIRKAVGNKMLIEIEMSGTEPQDGLRADVANKINAKEGSLQNTLRGNTLEDSVELLRQMEPYLDIVQVRGPAIDPSHPMGFNPNPTPFLDHAAYIKAAGLDIKVAAIGGFQYMDMCEAALSEGKADIISAARAWISNPNYGQLILEGNSEDMVPCIRCNKCHMRAKNDVRVSVCSVNPIIGLEHRIDRMVTKPMRSKKVAVIGGGPGGMKAAMELHDRGHQVTLYEASDALGGKIKHVDHVSFKWPLCNFKNYLIRQVEKRGIDVRLGVKATPELLSAENYDAIVAAIGSDPLKLPIPGVDRDNVHFGVDVLEHPERTGDKVVVIGGGDVGVETGMVLAQLGKQVKVLEMGDVLAPNTPMVHVRPMFQEAWESIEGFSAECNALVTAITPEGVMYRNKDGEQKLAPCDSVVLSAGMKAKSAEAEAFYGAAPEFYMLGDCLRVGTIQTTMRSAFATASSI